MTCSVFSCCNEARAKPQGAKELRTKGRKKGVILLIAPSDLLHALRSPFIEVVVIDVRGYEQYKEGHIESSHSIPCNLSLDREDLLALPFIQALKDKVTPGALAQALGPEKSTKTVGTCVVVHDSIGDTANMKGPASALAEWMVENEVVSEVGQMAGGFEAFKELNAFLSSANDVSSPARSSSSTALSRAMTPNIGDFHPVTGRPDSLRNSNKWKVTIEDPLEVPPAEVLSGRLFLGNKAHAFDYNTLKRLGITHVLNVSRDVSTPFEGEIKYCSCYVADSVNSDVSQFFEETHSFISEAMEVPNSTILVHCAGGVSRSTALVASYLMRTNGWSLNRTLQFIRDRHPAAAPNCGTVHSPEMRILIQGEGFELSIQRAHR